MKEGKLTRDDTVELFRKAANTCQPEHKYLDDPYPIFKDEIESTWCRSTSNTWARCGPREEYPYKAFFSVDIDYFNNKSIERVMAIITHEIAHLTYLHHKPVFWETMCDFAETIIRQIEVFNNMFDEYIFIPEYKQEIIDDPNSFMVDNRMETIEERREHMEKRMNSI